MKYKTDLFRKTETYPLLSILTHTLCPYSISHGWSTVAAKQGNIKETKISTKEVAIIQDVLLRAQAMERAEDIRVG